jgi:hypothetical protein
MQALRVAVVVMGVLIVAGVAVIGVTLARRVYSVPPQAPMAQMLLDEPAGTHIAGVSALPDRLALRLEGGGPDRVVMVDLRTGRVIARAGLAR